MATFTHHYTYGHIWDGGSLYLEPEIISATYTLDENWNPYCQATIVIPIPDEETLELIDPREIVRATLTAYSESVEGDTQTELYTDLRLRARTIDHNAGTLTLQFGTAETVLMDYARVATTEDDSYLTYQASLSSLIDAVLDDVFAGDYDFDDTGVDADLTIFADQTNLVTNPSAETNTTGWTATSCTITRLASAVSGVTGSYVFQLTTPTNVNNYMYMDIAVTPGETYVFSGDFYSFGTPTGAAHGNARQIIITTGSTTLATSTTGSLAWTSMQRVYGEVTIPAGVTTARMRVYGGYTTTQNIRWDALKFAVKTGSTSDHTYFDGATTDTAQYTYDWTGTAHLSTSTRTDLTGTGRTDELFTWQPGVSAWDFLNPLIQASGLRLFSDGWNYFYLVDPTTYSVPGLVQITGGVNATSATDTITRASEDWFDSVVIKYSWINKNAVPQVRYDSAGTPGGKTLLVEHNRPWPGAGAAEALLHRAEAKGRSFDVSAISDYSVRPGQTAQLTLPETPLQTGVVSAVTFSFPGDEMTVKTRLLADTPEDAWSLQAVGTAWNEIAVGTAWNEM